MRDTHLFQLALGIDSQWFVSASDFDAEGKRLDIEIDFKSGARLPCTDCKAINGPVHHTKLWRVVHHYVETALAELDLSALKRVSIDETVARRGHNSDAWRIKEVCTDMSGAYIAGVSENLTEAEITFDKFHVMKLIGDAVDKVRRDETKSRPELKGSHYLWLKNDAKLSACQS